jgi:hypothetical protein
VGTFNTLETNVADPEEPVVVSDIGDWKSVPATAADIAVPLPLSSPVIVVEIVIAGVVVAVATDPANPLADTTDKLVTVPTLNDLFADKSNAVPFIVIVLVVGTYDDSAEERAYLASPQTVSKAIVPEEVIVPPDSPVPAIIEVTVPTFQDLFEDRSNAVPFMVIVLVVGT